MVQRPIRFWVIQGPGWLLSLYLLYAQGLAAIDYELGVRLGTQEHANNITAVGMAFWQGFAFGDVVIYIPLLIIGLLGHWHDTAWGKTSLTAALGISVYWPIVALSSVIYARDAEDWSLPKEHEYWIVLPLIALWAAWGLWHMLSERNPPKNLTN